MYMQPTRSAKEKIASFPIVRSVYGQQRAHLEAAMDPRSALSFAFLLAAAAAVPALAQYRELMLSSEQPETARQPWSLMA
jgi:hypothetical protein